MTNIIMFSEKFEDLIKFSPSKYQTKSREITKGGKVLETNIDDEQDHLKIELYYNKEIYTIHIVKFNTLTNLTKFWYDFVEDYDDDGINTVISAVPLLYGKYNSLYKEDILMSWFVGVDKIFYTVYGPTKSVVDDLKYRINNFK